MIDLKNKLISHKKASAAGVTLDLKRGFSYFSLCLGVWADKKRPDVAEAKRCLMNAGWYMLSDVEDFFGAPKTQEFCDKMFEKYSGEKK